MQMFKHSIYINGTIISISPQILDIHKSGPQNVNKKEKLLQLGIK